MEPENAQRTSASPMHAGAESGTTESAGFGSLSAAPPAFSLAAAPAQRRVIQRVEDPLSPEGLASIRAARGGITVAERSSEEFGFINPRALAFVPHDPDARGGNPRHVVFGALGTAIGRVNQLRISSSATPETIAGAAANLTTTIAAARVAMTTYLNGHASRIDSMIRSGNLPAGTTLATALAEVAALELTVEQDVSSYNIDIEGRRVRLLPVVPLNDSDLTAEITALRAEVRTLRAAGRTASTALSRLRTARTRLQTRLRSLPAAPNRRWTEAALTAERASLTRQITEMDASVTAAEGVVGTNTASTTRANDRIDDLTADTNADRDRGFSSASGTLIERPGGYVSGNSARATPELIASAVSGFDATQSRVATDYINVIFGAEGNPASLNTWDRLRITLGSGLGAAGVLQTTFLNFYESNPGEFERLFGRYGIGVARPHRGERGNQLTVVDPDAGTMLRGTPATEYIANNPALLAVLVNAGHDESWQLPLVSGSTSSVSRALGTTFRAGTSDVTLYSLLNGHVPYDVLARSMFALADDIHGGGAVDGADLTRLSTTYSALATEHHFDPNDPSAMPDAARLALAQAHIAAATHPNRRRHIDRVLSGE